MKKTIKNLAFILMLVVAFTCIAVQASAADVNDLTFVAYDDGVMVTSCVNTASGELTIPAEYNGKKVVKIGDRAFENCLGLTSVKIADTVREIGVSAFEGCTNLAEVTFPYDLETIGNDAFFACDALKSVVLYPNLKEIGAFAFFDCDNLESVVIPDQIKTINEGTFGECSNLKFLSLPLSLDLVDTDAFVNCSAFNEVYYVGSYVAWSSAIDWTEGNEGLFEYADAKFNHVHDYKVEVTKEPDCTNVGTSNNTCACGYSYRNYQVPALGHSAEKVPEVSATCENTGLTASEKCSRCGIVLTPPSILPATGHIEVDDVKVEPTCSATGLTAGKHCTKCNAVIVNQEVIEKLPHDYDYKELVPATLTTNGKKNGTCKVCNQNVSETLYNVSVFKLSTTTYKNYNGKVRTPAVTVQDSEGNTLVKGTDYTAKYDTGRTNPGIYNVKITLKGEYEGSKTLSFTILPAKAENLKAKASKVNAVKLTWDEVPGATGYRIYIFNSATGTKKVKLSPATTNSYTLTKDYNGKALVMGTKYKISVTPYTKASNGTYVFATEATELTFNFVPSAPSLKVTSTAKGKATLEWGNVAGETGYQVYYSKDGKTYTKYSNYKGWPDAQTISGLKSGTKYYFKVRAYTAVTTNNKTTYVYSAFSAVKNVTVK